MKKVNRWKSVYKEEESLSQLTEESRIFRENQRKTNPDYKYLFRAQTSGGKYWIDAYQTPTDVKMNSYSISSEEYMGGGDADTFDEVKQDVLAKMIGAFIGGASYKKIDVDEIKVSKEWINFLNYIKKYKYLEKYPSGSDQRKFYYHILWGIHDSIIKIRSTIHNFDSFFKTLFVKIDKVIIDKNWG